MSDKVVLIWHMKRTPSLKRAERVNSALALIKKYKSLAQASEALATQHGISKRQAYRYVQEAGALGQKVPIPDPKLAFTVKLSNRLIQAVRQYAKSTGQNISQVVTESLEAFLHKDRKSGKNKSNQ